VDGQTEDGRRRNLIAGLGDGRLQVLTACDIVSEGTDIPVVQAAILLRPTQSEALFLQQCGRVLRPAPGKDRAIILDHVGNCITHGLPDEVREWTLDGRAMRGMSKDNEPEVRVLQCPACYSAHAPADQCPACGHRYEASSRVVDQVDGQLTEITAEQAAEMRRRRRRIGTAATLAEFKEIAAELGYKTGWAFRMYEIRKQQGRAA
jgi:superfamily II DNA or RNA helicase